MTERVREYNVAACVDEFAGGVVALFALVNVGSVLDLSVGKSHSGDRFFGGVYEVFVIGAVGVVKEDEADFEIRGNGYRGIIGGIYRFIRGKGDLAFGFVVFAGGEGENSGCKHCYGEYQRKNFGAFHVVTSIKYFLFVMRYGLCRVSSLEGIKQKCHTP